MNPALRPPGPIKRFLSSGVSEGRYFFIDLKPRPSTRASLAFGGREVCDSSYELQRKSYPFVTLEYIAEGSGRVALGGDDPVMVQPGSLFAYGPSIPHRIEVPPGATLVKYFLCLGGHRAQARLSRHAPLVGSVLQLANHIELRELFEWLLREGQEHTPLATDICDRLLDLLLLKIAQLHRQRPGRMSRSQEAFLRCRTFIDERGDRLSSVEEIAESLRMDRSSLSRLFRRFQGVSPYQYLLRRKMNRAAQDFIRTGDLVKEVAHRSGYPDPYHFSRLFKAVHGVAPARFRALYADG